MKLFLFAKNAEKGWITSREMNRVQEIVGIDEQQAAVMSEVIVMMGLIGWIKFCWIS